MTFKLSPQLAAHAPTAFELYKKYFEANRHQFPKSVIAVVENPDWQGGYDSKSPHDGHLTNLNISGVGTEECSIELHLSKPSGDCEISIKYLGVLNFNFESIENVRLFPSWRYEQFKYYNPYRQHGIKETNMFTHEIEWVNGTVWAITASGIEVVWREIRPEPARTDESLLKGLQDG
jgi:hypothetical protein